MNFKCKRVSRCEAFSSHAWSQINQGKAFYIDDGFIIEEFGNKREHHS